MVAIPDSIEKGNPDDPLTLYGFGVFLGTTSCASPPVSKVELFLRMNDIPYEVEHMRKGAGSSPKGTGPYIKHGDVVLADSTFILIYLTNTYGEKIKVKPVSDPKADALTVAVQRICEDHLYWGLTWYRWVCPKGWNQVRPLFFGGLPFIMWFLPGKIRKSVIIRLHAQGFGRHSEKDVLKLLDKSLCALSGILGEKKFITGDSPCPQDCPLFGILDNYIKPRMEDNILGDLAGKYPNLVSYVDNMKSLYFPDENPSKFLAGSTYT